MPKPAQTIYLHIGTQKTGTTTLQHVGRENRDQLAARGVLYPQTPGRTNHIGLTLFSAGGQGSRDLMREAGLRTADDMANFQAKLPGLLRAEIEASGCGKIWFSNEHLSSRVRQTEDLARLAAMLQDLADEVKVIVYLRHQPEFYLSTYSMNIKAGGTKETLPPQSDREYYYNYEKMMNVWASAFGDAAICVRVFDRAELKNGDVVDDIFSLMGIERDPALVIPPGLNQSLDARTLQFLRLFRAHVPRYVDDAANPDHGDVVRALETMPSGPKFRVDAATMRRIADMFAPSNARVARRFLGRADGKLFNVPTYRDEADVPPLTVEQVVEIAAHLWCYKQRQIAEARGPRRGRPGLRWES